MKLDSKNASIGALILLAAIAGYVVLLINPTADTSDARGIFIFVIPVVQLLFTNSAVKPIQDSTAQLEKNTNGVLSAKIGEIADAAAAKVAANVQSSPTATEVVEKAKAEAKPRRKTTAKKKETDNG